MIKRQPGAFLTANGDREPKRKVVDCPRAVISGYTETAHSTQAAMFEQCYSVDRSVVLERAGVLALGVIFCA